MTNSTLICDQSIVSAYDDYWDNLTEAIIKADDLNGDAVITDATVELDADSGNLRVLEYTYAVP